LVQKLFVHTDFISDHFSVVFHDLFGRLPPGLKIHLPLESLILKHFLEILAAKETQLKIYPAFKESEYESHFNISDILHDLKQNPNCEIYRFPPENIKNNFEAKQKRDSNIINAVDTLVLGESLIHGMGLRLAELFVERNKRILSFPPDYFSFGYEGYDFLIRSSSAQLISPSLFILGT